MVNNDADFKKKFVGLWTFN